MLYYIIRFVLLFSRYDTEVILTEQSIEKRWILVSQFKSNIIFIAFWILEIIILHCVYGG